MRDNDTTRPGRTVRLDTRGVSPVIGAVLMLAVAVVGIAIVQTTAIPALNAQQEYEHNQRVQTDLIRLDTTVDRVAATGTGETAAVETGVRYPPRLFFVNPPPATGQLATTDQETVTIENAAAPGETGDYWNGESRTFTTRSIRYDPSYNEYDQAPETVYEPWAVYNRIGDETLPLTETDLVEGRQISLVAVDGQYSTARADTAAVNVQPTSAPVRTVTVANETDPITVTVSTGIREDVWRDLLDDELDPDGTAEDRYVTAIDCAQSPPEPCGELTITLEPGTYDLRLGEVAVGSGPSREDAAYLTDVEGAGGSVPENGSQRLVVEARDRYDNPVSGVSVDGSLEDDDGTLRAVSPVTDENGRAVFVYEAPETVDDTGPVSVTMQFGDGSPQRTVTFDVRVVDVSGSAGTTSAANVAAVTDTIETPNVGGGSDQGRAVQFALRADETATLTDVSVITRNDLAGRAFTDTGSLFGGESLPVTFTGELAVDLRQLEGSANPQLSEFVDPTSDEADLVVILEFADGSTLTLGIG